MRLDNSTILCGSLALPNRSSDAVALYNSALAAVGENSAYLAFEPTDLESAILGMRALGIRGFSISSPFKQAVLHYLDEIEDTARAIGAVNTVINDNGHLRGYNTDWRGAVEALTEVTDLAGKRAAIVGAGGAARAIVFGLSYKGAHVTVFNRTLSAAERLAHDMGCTLGGSLGDFPGAGYFDIVVNATPVGSYPDDMRTVIPGMSLARTSVVFDAVFSPSETELLKAARKLGCRIVSGKAMLLHQATFQIELFTGTRVPLECFERVSSKRDLHFKSSVQKPLTDPQEGVR